MFFQPFGLCYPEAFGTLFLAQKYNGGVIMFPFFHVYVDIIITFALSKYRRSINYKIYYMKYIVISFSFAVLCLCSCNGSGAQSSDSQTEGEDTTAVECDASSPAANNADTLCTSDAGETAGDNHGVITEEQAYEGVNNYCHKEYDWSVAEDNPSIMYVEKGEETESEYQVIFRSYTGAFVYFYVNKADGKTRMVEHVPSLNVTSEAGTINLFDYL